MKKFKLSEEKRKYAREYMRKYTARKRKEKLNKVSTTWPFKSDREQIVEEFLSSLKKVLLAA